MQIEIDRAIIFISLIHFVSLAVMIFGYRLMRKSRQPKTYDNDDFFLGKIAFFLPLLSILIVNCALSPSGENSYGTVTVETRTYSIGQGVVLTRPKGINEVVSVIGVGMKTETYPTGTYHEPRTLTCFVKPDIKLEVGDNVIVYRTDGRSTTRRDIGHLTAQKERRVVSK